MWGTDIALSGKGCFNEFNVFIDQTLASSVFAFRYMLKNYILHGIVYVYTEPFVCMYMFFTGFILPFYVFLVYNKIQKKKWLWYFSNYRKSSIVF